MTLTAKANRGLRAVALFEASKGLLVLLAALILFAFMNKDVQSLAERLVGHLHLNPDRNIPNILSVAFFRLTDGHVSLLGFLAVLYSSMRFIEAYGLWFERHWAEWFALVSGSAYLPIEAYELAKGITWFKIGLVSVNIIVVLYMASILWRNRRERRLLKESSKP
jgi:uncharacterized membrane protein (DUF2068 family)